MGIGYMDQLPIPAENKKVVPVTFDHQKRLIALFRALNRDPRFAPYATQVNIINVQSGHPFTQGKGTIVLPLAFYGWPQEKQFKVLFHEHVHLHQRAHPHWYTRYYGKIGFTRATISFPPEVEKRLMYNPDGEKYEWIWRGKSGRSYIPVGIDHKTFLIPTTGHGQVLPVNDVPEYARAFGINRQLYHPNEIVAHQITDGLL